MKIILEKREGERMSLGRTKERIQNNHSQKKKDHDYPISNE